MSNEEKKVSVNEDNNSAKQDKEKESPSSEKVDLSKPSPTSVKESSDSKPNPVHSPHVANKDSIFMEKVSVLLKFKIDVYSCSLIVNALCLVLLNTLS